MLQTLSYRLLFLKWSFSLISIVLLTPCCENGEDGDPESVVLYIYKKWCKLTRSKA